MSDWKELRQLLREKMAGTGSLPDAGTYIPVEGYEIDPENGKDY